LIFFARQRCRGQGLTLHQRLHRKPQDVLTRQGLKRGLEFLAQDGLVTGQPMLRPGGFHPVLFCQSTQKQCDGLFPERPGHGDRVLRQDLCQVHTIKSALKRRLVAFHQGSVDGRQSAVHFQT